MVGKIYRIEDVNCVPVLLLQVVICGMYYYVQWSVLQYLLMFHLY